MTKQRVIQIRAKTKDAQIFKNVQWQGETVTLVLLPMNTQEYFERMTEAFLEDVWKGRNCE